MTKANNKIITILTEIKLKPEKKKKKEKSYSKY